MSKEEQIAELKKNRDAYAQQASFQLGAFAGKIELLEAQLAEAAKAPVIVPDATRP